MSSSSFVMVLEGGLRCRFAATAAERGKYSLRISYKSAEDVDLYIYRKN